MTDAPNHHASDRILVDLIEADVDMAFGLVDDAREEFRAGNVEFAHAAFDDAKRVLSDIKQRLGKIDAAHSVPFGLLVNELRKAVLEAQSECGARLPSPSWLGSILFQDTLDQGGPCPPEKN